MFKKTIHTKCSALRLTLYLLTSRSYQWLKHYQWLSVGPSKETLALQGGGKEMPLPHSSGYHQWGPSAEVKGNIFMAWFLTGLAIYRAFREVRWDIKFQGKSQKPNI